VSRVSDARRADPVRAPNLADLGLQGDPALVFQPAVDLATGRLLGFEALLRWHVPGPDPAVIPPTDLIAWAESVDRMAEINAWVLSEACVQAGRWPSNLQIAVNCSPFQLRRREVASAAAAALETTGLLPERLTVEVTEAAVADGSATDELRELVKLGCQLTVDDIGSDWSILEMLEHHAVGTLKIDGSLIDGIEDPDTPHRAIVDTIINVSHSLRICIVAEGIESAGQLAIVRELGADVGQGYFFSPPISADEAYELAALESTPTYSLSVPREFVES
jgi:EAL domain-containing protein (putative c-di-GMP-specific phosphodiesterase class I)